MNEQSPKKERKISIVGFTSSKDLAPWGEPGWEIWICNNLWAHCPPQWDRLYDLHESEEIVKDRVHDAFLRGQSQKHASGGQNVILGDRPVFCFEPKSEWSNAQKFPREEITKKLGDYFTNSISWMIAHALMEGVTELHVYGVDMATGGEYAAQRPSCEHMLGIARGMGITVYVPPASDLLKVTATYGSGGDAALHAKMIERRGELNQRRGQIEQQLLQLQNQLAQLQGALETTNYVLDVWTNPRATSRHDEDIEAEVSPNGEVTEQIEAVAA